MRAGEAVVDLLVGTLPERGLFPLPIATLDPSEDPTQRRQGLPTRPVLDLVPVADQLQAERLDAVRAGIAGEPQPAEGQPGREYHRRERRTGYVERVLTLPQNIDDEQIRCEFRDGVLRIHLPKLAPAVPPVRSIPIRGAEAVAVPEKANDRKREPAQAVGEE